MSDNPLLDTVLEMTSASVDRVAFSDEALMLVRLAALVAVDAPPASYMVNLGAAGDTDLTLDDARSVLIAVAPSSAAPASSRRPATSPGTGPGTRACTGRDRGRGRGGLSP